MGMHRGPKSFTILQRLAALAVVSTVGLLVGATNPAHAVTVGTVLPGAISSQSIGLNFANNNKTRDTVGTLNDSSGPGCSGTCTAATHLGTDPSVSVTVQETVFEGTSGGVAEAKLGYYVEYLNATGNYLVNIHSTDSLTAPGNSGASASLIFGPAGPNTSDFNNFTSRTFEEAECATRCPPPGFAIPLHSFGPDNSVLMAANTPYFVQLDVLLALEPDVGPISASIDPLFSSASGGRFVFSAGVAPIPATLPLFATALAGLGWFGRRRRTA